MESPGRGVCVIGAGVIGLSSALVIKRRLPSTKVHVLADRFTTETTSAVAAGVFLVREPVKVTGDPTFATADAIMRHSFKHYAALLNSEDAVKAGIMRVSGYDLYLSDRVNTSGKHYQEPNCFTFQSLSTEQIQLLFPKLPSTTRGHHITTMLADTGRYLPYLAEKFQEAGGVIVRQHIKAIPELFDTFDVVVNCSGWRPSEPLVDDPHAYPTRGVVLRAKAPSIKEFVYLNDGTEHPPYIYPRFDDAVLGGVKEKGVGSTRVTPQDRKVILEKAGELTSCLQDAEVLSEHCGLRPSRKEVRLEKEEVIHKQQYKCIVHNYGHGGSGVSLSWGSAEITGELVEQALQDLAKKTKTKGSSKL